MIPSTSPLISISSEVQKWLGSDGVRIVGVALLAVVVRWFIQRSINHVVNRVANPPEPVVKLEDERPQTPQQRALQKRRVARIETLGSLLNSITTFVVGILAVLTILNILGIPLTPLLASAGIGGVVIGIGAQNVVKDFLNGLFMLFEDQYGVGDRVDTGLATGTVRAVGLRVTRLVDDNGVTWYVRNGEITRIGNHSRSWSQAIVDMPVSYDEDPQKIIDVIKKSLHGIQDDPPFKGNLVKRPEVVGVQSVQGQTMTIRVTARALPGQDGSIARALRQRIKQALDEAGIKGPPLTPGTAT